LLRTSSCRMFCVITNVYPVFVRIKKGSYHNSVITIGNTHHCYKKITSSLMYALDVIPFLYGHVHGWYIQTKTSRNKLCVIFNISCYEWSPYIYRYLSYTNPLRSTFNKHIKTHMILLRIPVLCLRVFHVILFLDIIYTPAGNAEMMYMSFKYTACYIT